MSRITFSTSTAQSSGRRYAASDRRSGAATSPLQCRRLQQQQRQAFGAIAWPFLRAPRVPATTKVSVVKAVLLSRGLFQAGCWPILTAAEMTRVHSGIMALFSRCLPSATTWEDERSYDRTLSELGVAAPMVIQRCCRNRSPKQLASQLLAARAGTRSWLRAVISDFSVLAAATDVLDPIGRDTAPTLMECFELAHTNAAAVRRAVRAYAGNPANSQSSAWAPPSVEKAFMSHPCYQCGMMFVSRQAMSVHCFRVHGHVPVVRRKVVSSDCPCCLQLFWTRSRLLEHLHKSHRCRAQVMRLADQPEQEVLEAEQAEASAARARHAVGQRRHVVELPAIRMAGPLTLDAYDMGLTHTHLLRTGHRQVLDLPA